MEDERDGASGSEAIGSRTGGACSGCIRAQGQQILRLLFEGRLLMTPHPNDTPAYYRFEGRGGPREGVPNLVEN